MARSPAVQSAGAVMSSGRTSAATLAGEGVTRPAGSAARARRIAVHSEREWAPGSSTL